MPRSDEPLSIASAARFARELLRPHVDPQPAPGREAEALREYLDANRLPGCEIAAIGRLLAVLEAD